MCPDELNAPLPERPAEGNGGFWWTVEYELIPGENREWDAERLWTLASMTGAIGSELVEDEGRMTLRADYLSSRDPDELSRSVSDLLPSFPGVSAGECRKTKKRAWSTQHLEAFPR